MKILDGRCVDILMAICICIAIAAVVALARQTRACEARGGVSIGRPAVCIRRTVLQ